MAGVTEERSLLVMASLLKAGRGTTSVQCLHGPERAGAGMGAKVPFPGEPVLVGPCGCWMGGPTDAHDHLKMPVKHDFNRPVLKHGPRSPTCARA